MKRILVLGGGFAGLWSAAGAMRKCIELKISDDAAEIVLVDQNPYHNIRVRNYESDLEDVIVPFDQVLGPIGVRRIEGRVVDIDSDEQTVLIATISGEVVIGYDRIILALGSQVAKPQITGLQEFGFDVDTYASAKRLEQHLRALPQQPLADARSTVLVIGAGLTGLEVATEMPGRLRQILGLNQNVRVILADQAAIVGSDMGAEARPVIERALASLGIELRLGVTAVEIGPGAAILSNGDTIPAATVVWCAGMTANPLAKLIPGEFDRFGRLTVDEYMRVKNVRNAFAAGDIAAASIDGAHQSVMSCQHGRPMGRFAGHNAAADLFGSPLLPLNIDYYVTIVDLGPAGAVYTAGWSRSVVADGAQAKRVKEIINRQRIYPPRTQSRADILQAAAPIVQQAPDISTQVSISKDVKLAAAD